jgi:hypothetical protein
MGGRTWMTSSPIPLSVRKGSFMTRIPRFAVILFVLTVAAPLRADDEPGFTPLFNGKDLAGWMGNSIYWSVQDGALTGRTTPDTLLKYNTFLVWQGGQPADFELRLKYRIVGGNSGVQYRSEVIDEEKFVVRGYQADIDSTPRYSGILYEEKARGILAERGQQVTIDADGTKQAVSIGDRDELQQKIRSEDWNDYRIVAKGNRLQHYINGELMSEVIDKETGKTRTAGVIAFQVHQGPPMTVQFKDIRLKELK